LTGFNVYKPCKLAILSLSLPLKYIKIYLVGNPNNNIQIQLTRRLPSDLLKLSMLSGNKKCYVKLAVFADLDLNYLNAAIVFCKANVFLINEIKLSTISCLFYGKILLQKFISAKCSNACHFATVRELKDSSCKKDSLSVEFWTQQALVNNILSFGGIY
jgi:hypothetical protein